MSKGTFEAYIDTTGGNYMGVGNIDISNSYIAQASATSTQPGLGLGGANVSVYSVNANVASAVVAVIANAGILGTGSIAAGDITVLVNGVGNAVAKNETPIFNLTGISVAANVITAVLSGSQQAFIKGATIVANGNTTVIAKFNDGIVTPAATAYIGGNGIIPSMSISLVGVNFDTATAVANTTSLAYIEGAAITTIDIVIRSIGNSVAKADVPADILSVGLVGIGVTVMTATASGDFEAYINGGNIRAFSVTIFTDYYAYAQAAAMQPAYGSASVSGLDVKVNLATAVVGTTAKSGIKGTGTLDVTGGVIDIDAIGQASAFATTQDPVFKLSALSVAANVVYAQLAADQSAFISGMNIYAATISLDSCFNPVSGGATAAVGGNSSGVSVDISLFSAEANVAIATVSSLNKAYISGGNIGSAANRAGSVSVTASGTSLAIARVQEKVGGGLMGLGVTLILAYANGVFEATAGGGSIYAATLSTSNTYRSEASATSMQPSGGADVTGLSIDMNTATAAVGTNAKSGVTAGGSVNTTGAITVSVDGIATAYATNQAPLISVAGISVAANAVTATLSAVQEAFVKGANVQADSISVTSNFNKNMTTAAATALLGGNGAGGTFSASLISAKADVATAIAGATGNAYIQGGVITATNGITVLSVGSSVAKANVINDAVSVGLVGIGLTSMVAYADGNFAAYIDGGSIKAASVTINTNYYAKADARTMQPNGGVSASVYNIDVNVAVAMVRTNARAGISGTGTLNASGGTVNILATGETYAVAGTEDPVFSLSYASVAANAVYAQLAANQSAFLTGMQVYASTVNVGSALNDGKTSGATALVGGNSDGTAVSIYGAKANVSIATASSINKAYVNGSIGDSGNRAGAVNIRATGTSLATAGVKQKSGGGLLGFGVTTIYAYADGTFEATVEGGSIYAASLTVSNTYSAVSSATSMQPEKGTNVTLVSVNVNTAFSKVGAVANAGARGGAINLTGNIVVNLTGSAYAQAKNEVPMLSISGMSVAANVIEATTAAVQQALLSGSSITANDITVTSALNRGVYTAAAGAYLGGNGASGSVSLVTVQADVITANASSTSRAFTSGSNITANNISLYATGTSIAEAAKSQAVASASLVGIGVTVMVANANGCFEAYLNGGSISAGAIIVDSGYYAKANAQSLPPANGSLEITGVGIKVNTAQSSVGVTGGAGVSGSGFITATSLTVKVTGEAYSVAEVANPTLNIGIVNIAANVANATLSAVQNAYLTGATIKAGTISVLSSFNAGKAEGATAKLGGNGSVSVSLVNGGINSATATANATSRAYISGATIVNNNTTITVKSEGTSIADGIVVQSAGVGLAAIGATVISANANGVFEAYINLPAGTSVTANLINVLVDYYAKANANTQQSGGGLSVSGVSVTTNLATAAVNTIANAYISGSGSIAAVGSSGGKSLRVEIDGEAYATAGVQAPNVSISGISVAANVITATLSAVQNAFIRDAIVTAPYINVESRFNKGKGSGATASLGGHGGVSITLVGATVNTATATANAVSRAYIKGAQIGTSGNRGAVTVKSEGTSIADAGVDQDDEGGTAIGLVTIGVTVVRAYANGTFDALIDPLIGTDTAASTIYATTMTVAVDYTATARAYTGQSTGGTQISGAEFTTNIANATTNATANAGVGGVIGTSGSTKGITNINTTGVVSITNLGVVNAFASFTEPNVSIGAIQVTVNVLSATVDGTQNARLDRASVTASGVNVQSTFNDASGMAQVMVKGPGTSVSLVGATVNTATATMQAKVKAFADSSNFSVTGDVNVKAQGATRALVGFANNTSISLVSLGVTYIYSYANGTFEAYVNGRAGTESTIGGNLNINAIYTADADAYHVQGGVGASLVSGDANLVYVSTGVTGSAHMGGSGIIRVTGTANITATGSATADVVVRTPVSISGVKVSAIDARATVANATTAYITAISVGSLQLYAGTVNVSSTITAANATADLASGTVELSVINAGITYVRAYVNTTNSAYSEKASVNGRNAVNITANTTNQVYAKVTESVSATFVALGTTTVQAILTNSNTSARVKSGTVAGGSVTIAANDTNTVITYMIPPKSISLGDDKTINAKAYVYAKNTTASVDSGALVTSSVTDINITANSNLTVTAQVGVKESYSGMSLGGYFIETYITNVVTTAGVYGTVDSARNVNVLATDTIAARAIGQVMNASLLYSGGSSGAKNDVSHKAQVIVGANAVVEAVGDIVIRARTSSFLYADISASSYGAGSKTDAVATNNLDRYTYATIMDGAVIRSLTGDLTIEALADTADIDSMATGDSGALFSGGEGPRAYIDLDSYTATTVGAGVTIDANFGTLYILAVSLSDTYAYAYRRAVELAGSNRSYAYIDVYESVKVDIAAASTNGTQTNINANTTYIEARIDKQKVYSYAKSFTGAAASNTKAYAYAIVNNDLDVTVGNAYVGGVDYLGISAVVANMNITSYTYAEIVGATGWVYAESYVGGASHADVTIKSIAHLAGKDVVVTALSPEITESVVKRDATAIANTIVQWVWEKVKEVITRVVKKVSKIPIIGWFVKWITETIIRWVDKLVKYVFYSDAEQVTSGTFTSNGSVCFEAGASVHLGGCGSGIYVEIDDAANVYVNGTDDDFVAATDVVKDTANKTITIWGLKNEDTGSLTVNALNGSAYSTGDVLIYTNTYLPAVDITNYSDYTIILRDMKAYNGNLGTPAVRVNSGNTAASFTYVFVDDVTAFTYDSYGDGDLIFGVGTERRETDIGEGTITIDMHNHGSVYTERINNDDDESAFVAANTLTIVNAINIGADGSPFIALLFDVSEYAGMSGISLGNAHRINAVDIVASNNIYTKLGLVVFWKTETAYNNRDLSNQGTLNLNRITAGSVAHITILDPQCITDDLATLATMISIAVPGTTIFINGETLAGQTGKVAILDSDGNPTGYFLTEDGLVTLPTATNLDGSDYLMGTDSQYNYYSLPTGTTVITEKTTGKIVSVALYTYTGGSSSEDGYSDGFNFTNVTLSTDSNGPVITISGTGATYDQKVTFDASGNAYMAIGENGATTYVIASADGSWILPSGVRVYFRSAFIDANGGVVSGVIWQEDATYQWIIVESFTDLTVTVYHVAKVTKADNTFVEGYIYAKSVKCTVSTSTDYADQTVTVAADAVTTYYGGINNTYFNDCATLSAAMTKVVDAVKAVVTNNIAFTVTVYMNTQSYTYTVGSDTNNVTEKRYTIQVYVKDTNAGPDANSEALVRTKTNVGTYTNATGASYTNVTATNTQMTGSETMGTALGELKTVYKAPASTTGFTVSITVYVDDGGTYTANVGGTQYCLTRKITANGVEYYYIQGYKPSLTSTLQNTYFAINAAQGKMTIFKFSQSGSGEISGTTYNGGYRRVDGGVLFVSSTDSGTTLIGNSKLLIQLTDRALAILPGGVIAYVALEKSSTSTDIESTKLSVADVMTRMIDTYGDEAYLRMQYGYYNGSAFLTPAQILTLYGITVSAQTFNTSGNDAAYNSAYAQISGTDLELKPYNADGYYVYDTTSAPLYLLQSRQTGTSSSSYDFGQEAYAYQVVDEDGNLVTGTLEVNRMAAFWGLFLGTYSLPVVDGIAMISDGLMRYIDTYGFDSSHTYTLTALYDYAQHMAVVVPTADGTGATVTYKTTLSSYALSKDANGYAIIDQYTRVIDGSNDTADMPMGTLLYLNSSYEVVAYMTPDGTVRVYTDGTTMEDGASAVYEQYDNGCATVNLSTNTSTLLVDLVYNETEGATSLDNVYMTVDDGSFTGSDYDHASYFGYDADGALTKLTTGTAIFNYELVNGVYQLQLSSIAGSEYETAIAVYNTAGAVALYIINSALYGHVTTISNSLFIYDNSSIDSDGNTSLIAPNTVRNYAELEGESSLSIGTITAPTLTLIVNNPDAGAVSLVDGGTAVNIVSDEAVIQSQHGSSIFTQSNPMIVTPATTGGTIHMTFVNNLAQTDSIYTGTAYILANGNVNITDSLFGTDGTNTALVNLIVATGSNATFDNLEILSGASLFVNLLSGNGLITNDGITADGGILNININGSLNSEPNGHIDAGSGSNITVTVTNGVAMEHITLGGTGSASNLTITAGGLVSVTNLTSGANDVIQISAGGNVRSNNWTLAGDTTVTATDIYAGSATLNDGHTNLHANRDMAFPVLNFLGTGQSASTGALYAGRNFTASFLYVDPSVVNITVVGDAYIGEMTIEDNSILVLTVNGDSQAGQTAFEDSDITIDVTGDILITGRVDVTNSNLVISGGGTLTGSNAWNLSGSHVTMLVHGNIALDDTTVTGTDFIATSTNGGFATSNLDIQNSLFRMNAAGDITGRHVTVQNSLVTMTSLTYGGNLTTVHQDADGGGEYRVKTLFVTASNLIVDVYGDIVIASDENDGLTGVERDYVFSVKDCKTDATMTDLDGNEIQRGVTMISRQGGMSSAGAGNYLDSWIFDNSTVTVDVYGDIDIRDTMMITNWAVANITSHAGTLTNVDYDIGGTGQRSMWKLRNSKMNLSIFGNIFIDHLYVELSVAAIVADEGMFESMTWYIYGSKFTVQTGNRIRVYNDDPIPNPEPAVTLIACDDSLFIIDAETYDYVNLGVLIESGDTVTFETPGNGSNDFYVESSTVSLTAMNQIRTPETVICGAVITEPDIYFFDGTDYLSMIEANRTDRFAQSDVVIVSTLGGYTGDILDIDDSTVSMLFYGDIDLTSATQTDLRTELDVVNSTLTMTSTTGGLYLLDANSLATPDWNIVNSTVNVTVQADAYVPVIESALSTVNLRSIDGSIYFNKINARRSRIRLDAGNDIKTVSESGMPTLGAATSSSITFEDKTNADDPEEADDDSNAALTLKAGGDIGSSALWLYIDVPAELTVTVEHVTNLFADLQKRPLNTPVNYAVLTGYDENGVFVQNADGTNDYLRYSDERFFLVMANIATQAQLAQFIAQTTADVYGSADRVWRNFISDADALTQLITGSAGVTAASIAAVFGSKIATYVMNQVSGTTPSAADYLAAVQGAMNATNTNSNYILTETEAVNVLATLLTNGLITYTVDALGNTILGGTEMDLVNYLFRNGSDYASSVSELLAMAIEQSNMEPDEVAAAKTDAETQRAGEETKLTAATASLTNQVNQIKTLSASLTDAKAAYDAATNPAIKNQKAAEMTALMAQLTAAETAAGAAQAAMTAAQQQIASIQTILDALNHRLAQLNDSYTEEYTEAELKNLFDAASATNAQNLTDLAGAKIAASQTSASLTDARAALKLAISNTDHAAIAAAAAAVSATDAAYRQADALLRLYTQAADMSYQLLCTLANTHIDPPARTSTMVIGEIDGEAYLYNEGDITLTVSGSDITIGNIRSERGEVTVTNLAGSIYGADLTAANSLYADQDETYKNDDGVHVNARYINLYAAGSIGTALAPLVTEQRDNGPVKVYDAEIIYLGQQAGETVSDTEFGETFGIRFEDLRDFLDVTGAVTITVVYPDGMEKLITIDARDLRNALNVANTTGGPIMNLLQMASGTDLLTRFAVQAAVRYDWLRVDDKSAGTRLNATANGGGIYVSELTGDMNLGNVVATGDVVLTAPGSIHGAEQTGTNLVAGGNASLTATGGEIGTATNKLTVAVEGNMTTVSAGSVYLAATGDLNLTASCGTGHIEITVSATSLMPGDLNFKNTAPVTLTGYAYADGAVHLTNNGDIGTLAQSFLVDTDANGDLSGDTLALCGNNVYVSEQSGDAIVDSILATGDLKLSVPGNLYNAAGDKLSDLIADVREALLAANAARAAYDAALGEYNAITRCDEIVRTAAENLAAQAALTAASGTNLLALASLADARLAYELNPTTENYVRMVGADAAANAAATALTDAQTAAQAAAQAAASATDYLAYTQALYDAAAGSYGSSGGDAALAAASSADTSAAEDLANAQAVYDADPTPANQQALEDAQAAYDTAHATYTALLEAQAQSGDARAIRDQAIVSYTNAVNNLAATSATNAAAQMTLVAVQDVLLAQMAVNDAQDAMETAEETYAATPTGDNETRLKRARSGLDAAEALLAAQRAVKAALASGTELIAAQAAAEQAKAVYDRFLATDAAQATYDGFAAQTDTDLSLASATDALSGAQTALTQAQADQAAAQAEYDAKKNTATPTILAQLLQNLNEAKAAAAEAQGDYDAAKLVYDKARAAADLAQKLADLQPAEAVVLAQNELNRIKEADPANTGRIAQAELTLAAAEEAFRRNETVIDIGEKLEEAQAGLDEISAILAASETDIAAASDTNAQAQSDYAQAQIDYASMTDDVSVAALSAAQAAADAAAQTLYDKALEIYETLMAYPAAQALVDQLTAALATATDALNDSQEALAAFEATGAAMDDVQAAQEAYDAAQADDDAANDLASQIETKKGQAATETDAVNAAYAAYVSSTDMAAAEANRQAYDLAAEQLRQTQSQIAALEVQLLALTGTSDTNLATATSLASLTDANTRLGTATDALTLAQGSQTSYATSTSTSAGYLPASGTDAAQDPRIQVGGDATITVGGSFGTEIDAVTMDVEGTLDLDASGGAFIESTDGVTIGHISAGGDLDLVATGDITDDTSGGASVTASDTNLMSLFGSVGGAGNPVNLNVDSIGGSGLIFNVTDTGNTGAGNISGGDITIVSGGAVTQLPGTVILGGTLILTAPGDVTITTDVNHITVTGGNINIDNMSPALIVEQITGGNVYIHAAGTLDTAENGGITADNLTILAAGDIGHTDDPITSAVSGSTSLTSIYGVAFVFNNYTPPTEGEDDIRRLTDKETTVYVEGHICWDAYLVVTALKLQNSCEACKLIQALIKKYGLIVGYNIGVYSTTTGTPYWGSITVSIPVGIQYNNMTLTVAHCKNGVLELIQVRVMGGRVTFTTDALSPFAVLGGSTGIPKTGDAGSILPALMLLAALLLLCGVLLRRKKA